MPGMRPKTKSRPVAMAIDCVTSPATAISAATPNIRPPSQRPGSDRNADRTPLSLTQSAIRGPRQNIGCRFCRRNHPLTIR